MRAFTAVVFTVVSTLLFFGTASATPAHAPRTSVTYSTAYDVGSTSLNAVACSNGANGMITKGFTTFGSLPHFPYIGGANAIAGWNSDLCGSCWSLTYEPLNKTIYVQAIDTSPGQGFNIAKQAMDVLTNGQGLQSGKVTVVFHHVEDSFCA